MTEPRFLEQLQELDAKAAAVREQEARGTAACADVRGILDRLRVKVRGGDNTPEITRTSIPDTTWVSLAVFTVACPQELHPAFTWQSSSSCLWVPLKIFRNTEEILSTLHLPIFNMWHFPHCFSVIRLQLHALYLVPLSRR